MACPKAALRQPLEHAVIVVAAGDISAPELTAQQLTATLVEQQQPAAALVLGDSQYPTAAWRTSSAWTSRPGAASRR